MKYTKHGKHVFGKLIPNSSIYSPSCYLHKIYLNQSYTQHLFETQSTTEQDKVRLTAQPDMSAGNTDAYVTS